MERRLAGWKRMYLSKGARLTLIKSSLSNIPTYYLSLFPMPVRVANRLDKIQKDFLWGGIGDEKKFHLVSWKKICTPLYAGGLGVHNLIQFNRALLGKWLWRYGREREALWRLVIDAKFQSIEGGWCSKEVLGSFGVGVWKHIRRGWEDFRNFVRFEVGSGANISFWHDRWCGDSSLKQCFPALFCIVRNKDAMVAENLVVLNGVVQWNVLFTRHIQDWEMDMVLSLFDRLYSTSIRHGEGDRLVWNPSKKGLFEVNSFYVELCRKDGPSLPFPWKNIWRVKAPTRVAFFVWSAALGKILTHDNLRKRNVIVMEWCCLCKKSGESIDHLLLHCEVARALWSYVLNLFGVEWVMPHSVLELLISWGAAIGSRHAKEVWRLAPLCLLWCIWRERNARLFEDVETPMVELRKRLLNTLYSWIAPYRSLSVFTFVDFLNLFSVQPA
jgi:hypothetical protein